VQRVGGKLRLNVHFAVKAAAAKPKPGSKSAKNHFEPSSLERVDVIVANPRDL